MGRKKRPTLPPPPTSALPVVPIHYPPSSLGVALAPSPPVGLTGTTSAPPFRNTNAAAMMSTTTTSSNTTSTTMIHNPIANAATIAATNTTSNSMSSNGRTTSTIIPPVSIPKVPSMAPSIPPPPPEKKLKTEAYLVKKYKMTKTIRSIEAFQRYTKAHRMTDATFALFPFGSTMDKPIVFSCKIGGQDLSWGRGKSRDEAIDNACRAAFALVNAHGYQDFELNPDCFIEEPKPPLAPLPPPPPPPPLAPLMGGGLLPPMPTTALPPPPPPPFPPPTNTALPMLPPPSSNAFPSQRPEATSVMGKDMKLSGLSLGMISSSVGSSLYGKKNESEGKLSSSGVTSPWKKNIKGGLILLYDAGDEDGDDEDQNDNILMMEERRARMKYYGNETFLKDFMSQRRTDLETLM